MFCCGGSLGIKVGGTIWNSTFEGVTTYLVLILFSELFTFAQFSIHYNAIKISLCKLISCNFPFELPFNITLAKVAEEIEDYLKRSWILFPHWPPWCKFSEALCHAKKLNCTQDECNPWPKNASLCTKSLHYLWMQEWIMFLHRDYLLIVSHLYLVTLSFCCNTKWTALVLTLISPGI